MFCYAVLRVFFSFAIILMGKWDDCCNLIVFLMFCACKCYVALLNGTVGWSAVCDCGILWLYSLLLSKTYLCFSECIKRSYY